MNCINDLSSSWSPIEVVNSDMKFTDRHFKINVRKEGDFFVKLLKAMWNYSKSPYPSRNRIIPNEATVRHQEPQAHTSLVPDPWMVSEFKVMPFRNLMTHGNEGHWVLGLCAIPTIPFLYIFWHWSCNNMPAPAQPDVTKNYARRLCNRYQITSL